MITVNPVDIAKKLNKIDEIDNNVRDLNSKIDKLFDGGDGKKRSKKLEILYS